MAQAARQTAVSGLVAALRWPLFRSLERLSDLRGNVAAVGSEIESPATPQPAVWVFVSTIGELNAIDPFLRAVAERTAPLLLVLITDHAHYKPTYLARYPGARICVTLGHSRDAAQLTRRFPPTLLLVAEIPCLPSDAPCRFSHAFVREARRAGAKLMLANGWLYGYKPPSRMDRLEREWFGREYVQSFDVICMQTEVGADHMCRAGALRSRVQVLGNIKFDAAQRPDWAPQRAHSASLLQSVLTAQRPVVVAGCLTEHEELLRVLDAFLAVRLVHASALLVLAPRHPEVAQNMALLRDELAARSLPAAFRSTSGDAPLAAGIDVLVLDTMGDLRDFYAVATVAHVGVDHNVLEPLAFAKPVTVSAGWNPTYPSYPVFQSLRDSSALLEAVDAQALSRHWLGIFAGGDTAALAVRRAQDLLVHARGALRGHLAVLEALLASCQ